MTDISKLKELAENYIALIDSPDEDLLAEARDMYDDASDADTVLGLIKELAIREHQVKMLSASVCEKITKIQYRRDKLEFFRAMAYLGWALAITGPLAIIFG